MQAETGDIVEVLSKLPKVNHSMYMH